MGQQDGAVQVQGSDLTDLTLGTSPMFLYLFVSTTLVWINFRASWLILRFI